MNIGKGKIQIGKEALFQETPLQQPVWKKPKVMYLLGEIVLKMNVERDKIFKKLKIEHTHGMTVSMLLDGYNKFTASLKFCC